MEENFKKWWIEWGEIHLHGSPVKTIVYNTNQWACNRDTTDQHALQSALNSHSNIGLNCALIIFVSFWIVTKTRVILLPSGDLFSLYLFLENMTINIKCSWNQSNPLITTIDDKCVWFCQRTADMKYNNPKILPISINF